jgi:hypothetical protein
MFSLRSSILCTAAGILLAASGWLRAEGATTTAWHSPMLANGTSHATNPDRPYWVDESLEPSGRARIARIVDGKAYVVLLDGGLYQGFRTGVVCTVQREGAPVAQLIIVASEEHRAAALITAQPNTVIITPGDDVRVSTL